MEFDAAGCECPDARRGYEVLAVAILDPRKAVGSSGQVRPGPPSATVLRKPTGCSLPDTGRTAIRSDARLGTRRQDQRMGPGIAALFRPRLHLRRARWLGDPVANSLQGHRPLLR